MPRSQINILCSRPSRPVECTLLIFLQLTKTKILVSIPVAISSQATNEPPAAPSPSVVSVSQLAVTLTTPASIQSPTMPSLSEAFSSRQALPSTAASSQILSKSRASAVPPQQHAMPASTGVTPQHASTNSS
ncbi:hypothetical protein PoB_004597900 [Plakobranchus ocellatus]|uniref:Uncharacterized protein n=1 Tax=Plakobranchus ocellatus TaxID=259542 RepID=A0AAV4BHA2_9GAST|nr:hypothetical protein PoB_004597900 [Plakobranchus ocellatus]